MQTNPTHRDTALDHLDAISAYSECLTVEWGKDRPDGLEVKYLTASIGRGLKLAEIHAALHIGAQLERLADVFEVDSVLESLRAHLEPRS